MILYFIAAVMVVVLISVAAAVKIIPQATTGVVERFGKYKATLSPGLNFITPFFDKVAYKIDMREQIVSFPPQPVITEDNLVVSIDTVIYFQVSDPLLATYEVSNYIQAIEQLTMATLRNIIGKMSLETALTSRDTINSGLRGELDGATGKWGIRVNRVELKGIDPPHSIIDAMEKQMRAERDKRASILEAEGSRQAAILTAEGAKQATILTAEAAKTAAILKAEATRESAILEAEGVRQAAILEAQGESKAILAVSQAIHDGNPDQKLLAYKYLETLPAIAKGENASTWVIPAELTKFLNGMTQGIGDVDPTAIIPADDGGVAPEHRIDIEALGQEFRNRADATLTTVKPSIIEDVVKNAEEASGVQPEFDVTKVVDGFADLPTFDSVVSTPEPPKVPTEEVVAEASTPVEPKSWADERLSDSEPDQTQQ